MIKRFKEFNSTHTILNGEVFTNEFLAKDFEFLTQGNGQKEKQFEIILNDASCVGEAIQKFRQIIRESGERTVTLTQLQSAADQSELYRLFQEIFLHRIHFDYFKELIETFSLEQLCRFYIKHPLRNPLTLLTFSKEYALERFIN